MNDLPSTSYVFGPFLLEVRPGIVTRKGQSVALTPKEFSTLLVLVEANGKLVPKEDLLARVWPDSYVGDGSLARNVSILRKALGDDLIETVPRRGYRLTVPVTLTDADPAVVSRVRSPGTVDLSQAPLSASPVSTAEPIRRNTLGWSRGPVRWVLLASLLFLSGTWALLSRPRSDSSDVRASARSLRIAVLPFVNYTGSEQQSYLCDGLTEAMISELSRLNPTQLIVIARSSAMTYKQTDKAIPQIARELSADYVLESSVRSAGDRLRVTTQLVRGSDASHVWTGEYERDLRDILDLQQQVSFAIAHEIRIQLSSVTIARRKGVHTVDPEAFRDYLLGRFYWNKRSEEGLLKSVEFFSRAIARDPQYARAYSGLADAYLVLGGGYLPDLETYAKARAAALKAIALDSSLGEAYASLAYEEFVNERDWTGSDENYQRSIALDPEYATAHARYALYLIAMSRPDEAVQQIDRALELDPLSLPITYNAGWIYFQAGRHEEGLVLSKRALEIDPDNAPAHGGLAVDYLSMGQFERAIEEFQKAQKLRGSYSPYAIEVAHVYAVEGRSSKARSALARLLPDPKWGEVAPYSFAVTYAALGQKDNAFGWLQKSVDDHSCTVIEISTDRALDPLRSDPRFAVIRRQFRLPG